MPKATCIKPDCAKPVQARGMCTMHYCRARRSGELDKLPLENNWHRISEVSPTRDSAVCSICGPTEIDIRTNSRGKTQVECATARREGRRKTVRVYTPEQRRAQYFRRFNVTAEWFEATLAAQGGGCAVCGKPEHGSSNWHIDHDHACCDKPSRSCGKCVRGILCHFCNTGLGCARDDMEILGNMIDYLHNSRTGA